MLLQAHDRSAEIAMIPSPKRIVETWSALVGMWGSTYLALLDELDAELAMVADSLQWPLLIIGALGTGSVIITSWKDSRQRRSREPPAGPGFLPGAGRKTAQ
jgi:hypothetical protein